MMGNVAEFRYGKPGVLLYDEIEGKLQCGFCGRWYVSIEQHARLAHGLSVSDYRAGAGLNRQTPLIAPALSQRRREVYGPIRDRLIAEGRMRRWDTDPDLWQRSKAAAVATIREGIREEGVAKERGTIHHPRALSDAQRAELPGRYADGATIEGLAARWDTSPATIRREMRAAGITARPAGIRPGTKLGPRKRPEGMPADRAAPEPLLSAGAAARGAGLAPQTVSDWGRLGWVGRAPLPNGRWGYRLSDVLAARDARAAPAPTPFGAVGRLDVDEGGKLQCHLCGGYYDALGIHAHWAHGVSATEYKRRAGLNRQTPLWSESYRAAVRARYIARLPTMRARGQVIPFVAGSDRLREVRARGDAVKRADHGLRAEAKSHAPRFPRRLPAEQEAELGERYCAGATEVTLATVYGLTPEAIPRILERLGIPRR